MSGFLINPSTLIFPVTDIPNYALTLYGSADDGYYYDLTNEATMFTDNPPTVAITDGTDIAYLEDLLAAKDAFQNISGERPTYNAGTGGAFNATDNTWLDTGEQAPGSTGTIACYCRLDLSPVEGFPIAFGGQAGSTRRTFVGINGSSGFGYCGIGTRSFTANISPVDLRSASAFHTVAMDYGSGTVSFYIDGVLAGSSTYSGAQYLNDMYIGARSNSNVDNLHWDGDIKAAFGIDRRITAGEHSDLHDYFAAAL